MLDGYSGITASIAQSRGLLFVMNDTLIDMSDLQLIAMSARSCVRSRIHASFDAAPITSIIILNRMQRLINSRTYFFIYFLDSPNTERQ